jgi:predicted dehydrogenase
MSEMSTDAKLRVGLIGLGAVGQVHLEAYRASALVEVVAIADVSQSALDAYKSETGLRTYSNHLQMLESEQLDIACVLTPASLHVPVALDCAQAGVAVLCEKPLSISSAECERLIAEFAALGVPLFYGSSYRFLPTVRAARKLILDGSIGDVVLMREQAVTGRGPDACHPYGPIHYPPGFPGGSGMGLVDHGIHLIDIMAWITGLPIIWAYGRGNISGEPLRTEYATLGFANGATGHLLYNESTWSTVLPHEGAFSAGADWNHEGHIPGGSWQAEPGSIMVHGTKGALRIHHYANALFLNNADGVREVAVEGVPAPDHFRAQIDSFAASLATSKPPETSATDGLRAVQILEAIYESDRLGQTQNIPIVR